MDISWAHCHCDLSATQRSRRYKYKDGEPRGHLCSKDCGPLCMNEGHRPEDSVAKSFPGASESSGLWPSFEQQVSLSLSIQSHPAAHQLYKEEPARGISIHHHSLKLRDQIWHPQDTQSTVSSHITRTNKGTSTFQWKQPPTVCYYAKNGTRLNKERSRIWKPSPTVLLPIYNSRESEFSK